MSEPGESGVVNPLPSLVGDIFSGCRARYRPIDDRASYWTNFFFGGGGGGNKLRKFSEQKKKQNNVGIRIHAHSFNSPVQLPLAHRDTAEKVCLNHFFMIQLFLLLALTSPNPNPSQVLALALTITRAPRHRCRISFNIQLILAFPVT